MTTVTPLPPLPRTPAGAPPRRTPARRRLTGAAALTVLCLAVTALWVCYVLVHLDAPGVAAPRDQLAILVYALPTAGAGMLLHAHRPGNPLGWVMLVYALTSMLPSAAAAPVWVEVSDPGLVGAAAVVRAVCDTVSQTLFYVLPLWLPAGRLTTRKWWWYIGAVTLWVLPDSMSFLDRATVFGHPNPLADSAVANAFGSVSDHLDRLYDPVDYLLIGIAAAVLLVRLLRRTAPRRRAHLAGMLGAYLLWAGMQDYYTRRFQYEYWLSYSLFTAAGAVWAVAVAFLVVRDGGWRLDRAARSVLTGLLLAAGLTVVFVVCAALLAGWLEPGRGGAALLLIALLLALGAGLPRAARRAVGLVDRLYYGERAQPYQVLRALAGQVRQVVDPERLPSALCGTVAEELRLPGVALAVTTRAGRRPLAAVGRLDGPVQGFPLVHHGTTIGELTVGLRAGEERLDPSDVDILRSLADQASPAVASLRLQEDLQASREQIVAAREEERRWLRRDIHDGLGPALAGLRLRVDNAASAAVSGTGTDALAPTLEGISGDLALTIKEVRRITDRLGPAPLGEFGLTRAVEHLAATFSSDGLTVSTALCPDPLPELPAAVEVAAYRITAEALNNVLRHARARHAEVALRVDEANLVLTVQDDGIGLGDLQGPDGYPGPVDTDPTDTGPTDTEPADTDPADGVGLRSMSDRAAEIGGRCTVGRLPRANGTRVLAVLPRHPSRSPRPRV
ncbi:histidine kinase [Kitasatospora purpeofusca]|uniref:GAF domain-containing sensor histidine kinase n=1 Tax=Kitasatospora purpeofusca TaxID=67352 RepID=UPI0022532ADA|nr:GAF domain-containing sensor histidine kinase [Kitasatospora purpeofusca]MCX4688908.1 histidine kinase [Kitasatospora purpeofusca]